MMDPPPPAPTPESRQDEADATPPLKPHQLSDDPRSSTSALDEPSTTPLQPTTPSSALPPLLDQLSMCQPPPSGMPATTRKPMTTRTTSNARPLSRSSLESTMDELNQVSRGVSDGAASRWLPEPENCLRRPFWQLSLLRATITTGGFLTPRLHVPRLVWEQYGAKLNGLTTKVTAFEAVMSLLVDRVLPLELLSSAIDAGSGRSSSSSSGQNQNDDGEAARRDLPKAQKALRVLEGVRAEFDFLQNSLARPFPFIKEVPSSRSNSGSSSSSSSKSNVAMALASSSSSSSTSSSSGTGGMQQIRGLMASFGKKIQKSAVSAMTAVERMGVALPAKISDEDLLSYASLVSEMCHKAQRLDEWFLSLDGRRKELQDTLRREVSAASSSSSSSSSSFSSSSLTGKEAIQALLHCVEGMLVELLHCARFLQEVVIELLLRDVESLVDSYLRKARKVFTRMVWELEEQENS